MGSALCTGTETGTVVIIDPMDFRRAGLASLLEPWAQQNGLEVHAKSCGKPPVTSPVPPTSRMLILSMGHWSLEEPVFEDWVQSWRAMIPDRPMVIMSEREELDEAISAFRAGASGFIPMSLDPSTALHAFTFLLAGGTYYPPTLLPSLNGSRCRIAPLDTPAKQTISTPGGLTSRQQDVLDLLRKGRPNKVIARALSMQEATVKVHVRQILRKLGASNRTEAALICASEIALPAPVMAPVTATSN